MKSRWALQFSWQQSKTTKINTKQSADLLLLLEKVSGTSDFPTMLATKKLTGAALTVKSEKAKGLKFREG